MKLEHIMAFKAPVQFDQALVRLHFITVTMIVIASANSSSITYRGNVQLLLPFFLQAHPYNKLVKQPREASDPVRICR